MGGTGYHVDLGYGFVAGENRISKKKVCYWLHTDKEITWDAFIWYIADYADILDFGEDWIVVRIVSVRQREFFYERTVQYSEEMCSHNYNVDKSGELWMSHKQGAERNKDILLRLVTR